MANASRTKTNNLIWLINELALDFWHNGRCGYAVWTGSCWSVIYGVMILFMTFAFRLAPYGAGRID